MVDTSLLDDDEDISKMDMGSKYRMKRSQFASEEAWEAYNLQREATPEAAFQFGLKRKDGRKTRKEQPKQKLERELASARDEASAVGPLQDRVKELEQSLKTAQAGAAEADGLRKDVEKGVRDLDRVRAAHGQAVIDLESARSDLEAAQAELEELRRTASEQTALATDLQQRLTTAEEQAATHANRAQVAGDRAGKARDQLLKLAEELGLPH